MKAFSELYAALDATTKTSVKIAALSDYFRTANDSDAAWAVYFLSGNRPKRLVSGRLLRDWIRDEAEIEEWLFEECYGAVGDLAETAALLAPASEGGSDESLTSLIEEGVLPLRGLDDEAKRRALEQIAGRLDSAQLFVWLKLLTGAFRVGVSRRLVVRALAELSGVDAAAITHRLMGAWQPTAEAYRALFEADTADTDRSRPYPFCLAHPLEAAKRSDESDAGPEGSDLGSIAEWQAEWKWDGIRGQLIRRGGETYLWSRGEDLVTESFPELAEAAAFLPDGTVVDGEILAWENDGPQPFGALQRRLGRKKVGAKLLREVPVVLTAYDLLELDGKDVRESPLDDRRKALEGVMSGLSADVADRLRLSPIVEASSWDALAGLRESARERRSEGLMLKRRDSPYVVGRPRGVWWKWKVEPYTLDAVLIYAQRGHGRRASLYTDYTFGLWSEGRLLPFAKAYSGLSDAEIRRVDAYVRRNTVESFGPVRSVTPKLVFEIAFEDIRPSKRHKSGLAVRFPRMTRWREDKKPEDADSLETARALMS